MEKKNPSNFWNNYKENIIIESLTDEFKCAVCKVLMTDTYLLSCSDRYCTKCKDEFLERDDKICSVCYEKVDGLLLDKRILKKLKEIEIPCLNSEKCIWKKDITLFENHCSDCLYQFVPCDLNCGLSIRRNQLENHKSISCMQRKIKCEFCGIIKSYKNYMNHLDDECLEIPVNCYNVCMLNEEVTQIKKKDINFHLKICSNHIISCDICNKFLQRNQMENHFKDNIYTHTLQIYDEIKLLKKEKDYQNFEISLNKEKILKLEETMVEEINKNNQKVSNLEEEIKFLKNENHSKDREILKLEEKNIMLNFQMKEIDLKINPTEKITLNHGSAVYGLLGFSEYLLISGGYKDIKYWNSYDCKLIHSIPNAHTDYVSSLKKLDENLFASGSADKSIKIWNVESREAVKSFNEHTDGVWDLLVLSNNKIASGSLDKSIKLWDVNSNNSIQTLTGHSKSVRGLIEMKEDEIISCSDDKLIIFWDLKTSKNIKIIQAHTSKVSSIVKINTSNFATGSSDKTIKIWDYPDGNCMRILEGHTSYIMSLISIDSIIISGSNDNTIKIWNIFNGETLCTLTAHGSRVNVIVKMKEKMIVSGSDDENIIIWRNLMKIK